MRGTEGATEMIFCTNQICIKLSFLNLIKTSCTANFQLMQQSYLLCECAFGARGSFRVYLLVEFS